MKHDIEVNCDLFAFLAYRLWAIVGQERGKVHHVLQREGRCAEIVEVFPTFHSVPRGCEYLLINIRIEVEVSLDERRKRIRTTESNNVTPFSDPPVEFSSDLLEV